MKKLLLLLTLIFTLTSTSLNAREITLEAKITGLYVAFFNRAADQGGLTYWTGRGEAAQGGTLSVLQELSRGFATHPVFIATYSELDDRPFVEAIYRNALGREGDAGGITYWAGGITRGEESRSDMVARFIELSLTWDNPGSSPDGLTEEEAVAGQLRQDLITNKVTAALAFTHQLRDLSNVVVPEGESVEDNPAYKASVKIISKVTEDPVTVSDVIGFLNEINESNTPISDIIEVDQMVDTEAPIITIVGDNPLEIMQGETFTDQGAIAEDNRDGLIVVMPSGNVDMGVEGEYIIKYEATDNAGNKAVVERKVIVLFNGIVTQVSTLFELRRALRDAALNDVNDVIELAAGTYNITDDGRGSLSIDDEQAFNLTLRAASGLTSEDVILDGNKTARVLSYKNTEKGTLKLDRVSIINGKETYGAGVYAPYDTIVKDCNISNNEGIGLYSNGKVTIDNSYVNDNNSTGFVALGTTTTIVRDTVIAKNLNGGFSASGSVSVDSSQIIDNYSYVYYYSNKGGGFYASGDVNVTDSNISGNYLYGSRSEGGGFYASGNAKVVNSIFSKNILYARNSEARGGGFFVNKKVDVENCILTDNEIFARWDDARGAGFLAARASVENTTFFDNNATNGGNSLSYGGGFYVYYPSNVINSKFISNNATDAGGGLYVLPDATRGGANVINTVFINNSARYGSALYAKFNPHNVINSQFIGNLIAPAIKSYGVFINNIFDKNDYDLDITDNSTIYNTYIDLAKIFVADSTVVSKQNILEPYYDGEIFLNDDNIRLTENSPVIDKGLNPGSVTFRRIIGNNDTYNEIINNLTIDILGNQRIYNDTIDMGAAEYGSDK